MPCDGGFSDVSLYIHFPWCTRKCPYCDFNSHEKKRPIDERRYIDALIRDLDDSLEPIRGRALRSVFLGGGTPSLFSGRSIGRLIADIGERFAPKDNLEITLEANPGTVEHDSFGAYLDAGVNRLSVGVQSFDDSCLRAIGRIHDAQTALSAIGHARCAGFRNLNIDLMFGLPGQSREMAERDCRIALECGPSHVSCYQLTIEPNTLFHRYPPNLPHDDAIMDMQLCIEDILMRSGFSRYEVSAYAQPGMRCRHNLHYWEFGDYLGIGAGAHSKLTLESGVQRSWNTKHPQSYQSAIEQGNPWRHWQPVADTELLFEFMLNALRLREGFSLQHASRRTGLPAETILHTLQDAGGNLLELSPEGIRCTETGYRFIDDILQRLLP